MNLPECTLHCSRDAYSLSLSMTLLLLIRLPVFIFRTAAAALRFVRRSGNTPQTIWFFSPLFRRELNTVGSCSVCQKRMLLNYLCTFALMLDPRLTQRSQRYCSSVWKCGAYFTHSATDLAAIYFLEFHDRSTDLSAVTLNLNYGAGKLCVCV